MEIKNDILKKVVANSFGWDMSPHQLLECSVKNEEQEAKDQLAVVDDGISHRAGRRLVASEINKQKNMEDVIKRADLLLQSDNMSLNGEVESDQSWVEECLEGVGRVFNDDMKDYWARLLAGEIRNPGYYSKRIINFMKMISQKDAKRIKKMCQYVMYTSYYGDAFIIRYDDAEYTYEDLSFLMELGLIDSSNFIVKQYGFEKGKGLIKCEKNNIGLLIKIESKEYDLPIYSFTELGKEVLSIIDDTNVNINYLVRFAKTLVGQQKVLSVICGELTEVGGVKCFLKNNIYYTFPEDGLVHMGIKS